MYPAYGWMDGSHRIASHPMAEITSSSSCETAPFQQKKKKGMATGSPDAGHDPDSTPTMLPASDDVYVRVRYVCVCVHTESAAWMADVP